jgi:hypothetical protein
MKGIILKNTFWELRTLSAPTATQKTKEKWE